MLLNFTSCNKGGDGFGGAWTGRLGGSPKDRLLVLNEVAAVKEPKACGALMDILQAARMFFQSHVRCCNWHGRQIGCHPEEDVQDKETLCTTLTPHT